MNKGKFVPLILVLSLSICYPAAAQTITNRAALQNASLQMAKEENALNLRLLSLSRLKGWPMSVMSKHGRRSLLTGIDANGFPLYTAVNDNIISAATIRTNQIQPGGSTGLNLSGSTPVMKDKIAIWDGGKVRGTHVELKNRVLQKDNTSQIDDHSTHVSGTMIASGQNIVAKGMAFGAPELIAYDFTNQLSEMLTESPNLLISNHSYSTIAGWYFNSDLNRWEFYGNPGDTVDYKFGYYSTETQIYDSIAYNAPYYLIVKAAGNNRGENGPAVGQPYWRFNASGTMISAGNRPAGISNNDGYDVIATYGTAKNILTVGAVFPIPGGYNTPADVQPTSFSSWGPTDDGRIKPDVVADGVNVLSCIATSDNAYASFDGTSMSSPAAAGSLFLLQEYFYKLHNKFMRAATLKGIIIHTADEAGPANGPDYQYGWGLINMQKAADVITPSTKDTIIENNLLNGATFTIPVVASGKGQVIATISWTDPKGSFDPSTVPNNHTPKLVNDLDLRITAGSVTYKPWILNPSNPSAAATTGDNTLDNVEKIVIDDVVPGKTYTITVTHKGTLSRGQQAYSLILSGVGGSPYCASAPTSSAGTRIDNVTFGTINNTNPAGCTTYTDFTTVKGSIQANQTLPVSVKLSSCDASSASKIVKVFIDYNNNGVFTDPGETAATSTTIAGNGTYTGSITLPAGITVGYYTIMRVVAVETTNAANVLPCGSYGNGETEDFVLKVASASTDVGITNIENPGVVACSTDSARITVRIKNFGSSTMVNIPVTATITNGATTIGVLNTVCADTLAAFSDVVFTFQAPFVLIAGNTYTVVATTNLVGDQYAANNSFTGTINVSTGSSTASAEARVCSAGLVSLKANLTDSSDAAYWYDSPTATTPIASGALATTTEITPNRTYYLGLNDGRTTLGPANKTTLGSGSYNEFFGNFVNFTNNIPLTIESARLYIGHGGKITFIVADIVNYNRTTGAFNYFPISSTTIDVFPTTPNPAGGAKVFDAADTGAVYYLNLPVPVTGNHSIIIECTDSANIYRNNNLATNPYPQQIPNIFAITGNGAVNTADTTDLNYYKKFYYFFYNMKIGIANCPSPRVAVVADTAGAPPVITQNGDILTSSSATGNQWYLNGVPIIGATHQNDTAKVSGTYTTVVTDSAGCALTSNAINVIATAVVDVNGGEIGLIVAPNPNNGQFNLQFTVSTKNDLDISLISTLGQKVYQTGQSGFIGTFNQQVNAGPLSSGMYLLKIRHGNKVYVKKLLVK